MARLNPRAIGPRLGKAEHWIARLNRIGDNPAFRAEREAECALLGHDPSGEQFLTAHPTDVCYWCATEYNDECIHGNCEACNREAVRRRGAGMTNNKWALRYPLVTEAEFWIAPVGMYHIACADGTPSVVIRGNSPSYRVGIVRTPPQDFMDELQVMNCDDGLQRGIEQIDLRWYHREALAQWNR